MLTFLRRIINSRLGIAISFVVMALIAVLFGIGDIQNLGHNLSSVGGAQVATVGGEAITEAALRNRVNVAIQNVRQRQPGVTLQQFIDAGQVEAVLDQMINTLAIKQFSAKADMAVGKEEIDKRLSEIPAFRGLDGKFSKQNYLQALATNNLTDQQLRDDIASQILAQQLLEPQQGANQVPSSVATPYAGLLLERRRGWIAAIPTRALGAGAVPSAQELTQFYQRNRARYTIPERRVLRYAVVSPASVAAQAQPSDAELESAYRAQAARFAAHEVRDVTQVVVADRQQAEALAAKVKAGTPIAAAARAAGLAPTELKGQDVAGLTGKTSAALAKAAFAAPRGGAIGPVKGTIGYVVAQVTGVTAVPAKSLAQARGDLLPALSARKLQAVLGDLQNRLSAEIDRRTPLTEIATRFDLDAKTTAPLLADGRDPSQPAAAPDPNLAEAVRAAFGSQPGDPAQLVPYGRDGGFAVVALDRVVPATTPPLAALRDRLAGDFTIERARQAARVVAQQVVKQINAGTPLADALKATKLALPPAEPADFARAQLAQIRAQQQGRVPPPLALLFSMAPSTAKLLEAPQGAGWLIVVLENITPGDARDNKQLIAAMRADIGRNVSNEYAEQMIKAIRAAVKVKIDDKAVAKLRADLAAKGG